MNQHLEAAMSQLRNRAVMDHEEDRIDFLGKSPAEIEAVKEARNADRRDKWRRWVAAFPDDAAQLHRDTEWPMEEIPDRAALLYETLRNYEGLLEDESDQSPSSRQ